MKRWSLDDRYKGTVQFLCVCVDSPQVAVAFQHMFFEDRETNNKNNGNSGNGNWLVNSYIPSRHYMPVGFGQLGCSGFVVSDAKGNFVSRKTRAYLQYGEAAFGHVESLLREELLLASPAAAAAEPKPTVAAPKASSSSSSLSSATNMQPPASVGVDVLDDEHAICTESFRRARRDPTVENLRELHDILKAHFDHEEELLARHQQSSNSNKPTNFSSLHSHTLDHDRILGLARAELDKVAAATAAATKKPSSNACVPCQLPRPGEPRQ
mmetsp:Transcript_1232/g.3128  ORF Transcript_1232/g.3128 Transcript_1232/m.3128 type:complete len:268 (-) Transcript_1232:620-1423(-)